ncbi:MAG: hypothetical protein ACI89X_001379 [Planctomycetota bacterium]|jgi:hypothetical protein
MHAAKQFLSLVPLWLTSTVLAQELAWHSSLASALDFAKEKNRVMLIAVVMPGERGSDGLIAHYRDSAVRKVSSNCVCLRIDVGTARPSTDERDVLQRYLGAAPRDPIVVPHHVIVHPDGKTVLSSAAYQMTAGQLEWFINDGVKQLDPTFEWPLGERARAPEGLRYGDVKTTQDEIKPPPSKADVKAAITALKKGGALGMGSIEHYQTLLRSEESSAIKYVDSQVRGGQGMMARLALTAISEISPTAWSPMLVQFLTNRNDERRLEAARGLTSMAVKKTHKPVKKALKNEQEAKVRAWLLRAAVATGPKDKSTITAVEKAITGDKEAIVRMHAAVAAGAIESKEASHRLLRKALSDEDPNVRSAAAYAIATRRDKELAASLEPAIKGETDAEAKHWMELAIDTLLKKRDLRDFENFRTKVLKETRGRRNRNAGGGNAGGGNAGGGNGGGK